ncbi:MAG: pimeloyl-CoA dehydrogenase small subunit [Betaproteobacteria bacterium]|nr:MAG: pimeloyl-CoA dehydrogenase small subunit [Betaproteobacteria bacterium]
MNFSLSDEQSALKDTLIKFIDRDYTFDDRWKIIRSTTGWSTTHWSQLAEIGVTALPIAEADGGLGGNGVDTLVVMEQLGRGLVVEPYLGCCLLPVALLTHGASDIERAGMLERIAGGDLLAAFAHTDAGQRYERVSTGTKASFANGGFTLTGRKVVVLGGDCADHLLVSAQVGEDAGASLFLVDANATGVTRLAYPMQDAQRGADIEFNNAAATLIGTQGGAQPAIDHALDVACAALCAEAIGAMTELHKLTVEYLKTRKQFGRPIGMNQALQHRAVDMLMHVEMSRSMAIDAAMAVSETNAAARAKTISAAKVLVGQACRFVGQNAVQLHGGIGVTHELNVSHYFKRLTMIAATLGDTDWHLARHSDSLLAA